METVFAYLQFSKRGKVQKVLHALKYKQQTELGELLGVLLAQDIDSRPLQGAVLLPVPLHAARLRERGYNQALCVAKGIEKVLGYPIVDNLLLRGVKTTTQTKSGGRLRRFFNLSTAFQVKEGISIPEKVVLVDDVLTTGATLEAAARVLKAAGVKEIHVLCLAAAV